MKDSIQIGKDLVQIGNLLFNPANVAVVADYRDRTPPHIKLIFNNGYVQNFEGEKDADEVATKLGLVDNKVATPPSTPTDTPTDGPDKPAAAKKV